MNERTQLLLCTALSFAVATGCTANLTSDSEGNSDGSGSTNGGFGAGAGFGVGSGSGTGASGDGDGSGSTSGSGGSAGPVITCTSEHNVGRAPIRRLTRFEFNNSVESLLDNGDDPGNSLPPELAGNGFGNDADQQPISSFLAEQYGIIAADVSELALSTPSVLERFAPCLADTAAIDEASCTRTFVENFAAAAYRRPVTTEEVDELVALQGELAAVDDYQGSIAGIIEAVLQSPDFLYRVEFGEADVATGMRRPTGHEMASRLSYFFWGAPPDAELLAAAEGGQLTTKDGIATQATRLLDDGRALEMLTFFFSHYLPIQGLTDLARDGEKYPTFSPQIGALMVKETLTFLEREIFEGPGDWPSLLTAPYTYVNEELANYYGIPGVTGTEFRQVPVDTTQRKGLLTHGSILTGSTVSNFTNPVRRGVYLLRHIMCQELPPPPEAIAAQIMPPDPESGLTGRSRYSAHQENPVCANCHSVMDPPGFALENYDAVGLWRDQENGVTIDASGDLPMLPEPFSGPMELIEQVAHSPETNACFAENWLSYASGRTLSNEDACLMQEIETMFADANFNIRELLVRIASSDTFMYLPAQELQ